MRKNIFLSATAETAGNGKPDQSDVLTELTGMKALLTPVKLTLPDLISQHASLAAGKLTLQSEVASLKGDSTKLVAGATLPTDLVTAANTVATQAAEIATLKAAAKTVDAAAAAKVVTIGITDTTPAAAAATAAGGKTQTLTEKVLAAKGAKDLTELNAKHNAAVAAAVAV